MATDRGLRIVDRNRVSEYSGVPEQSTDIERELLKHLEAKYNVFFAGRLPRPPWETRSRVDALVTFAQPAAAPATVTAVPEDRVVHVTTFSDPGREIDKLRDLYDQLAEARPLDRTTSSPS